MGYAVAPLCSLSISPSPFQSQYSPPFASSRGFFLVCYAVPNNNNFYDLDGKIGRLHQPHWMGKKQQKNEGRWHQKADAISDQEAINLFDQLLAAKGHRTSIRQINQYLKAYAKTSRSPCRTAMSLFTRLIQAEGISPDEYTYATIMDCCTETNQVGLILLFSDDFSKMVVELMPESSVQYSKASLRRAQLLRMPLPCLAKCISWDVYPM